MRLPVPRPRPPVVVRARASVVRAGPVFAVSTRSSLVVRARTTVLGARLVAVGPGASVFAERPVVVAAGSSVVRAGLALVGSRLRFVVGARASVVCARLVAVGAGASVLAERLLVVRAWTSLVGARLVVVGAGLALVRSGLCFVVGERTTVVGARLVAVGAGASVLAERWGVVGAWPAVTRLRGVRARPALLRVGLALGAAVRRGGAVRGLGRGRGGAPAGVVRGVRRRGVVAVGAEVAVHDLADGLRQRTGVLGEAVLGERLRHHLVGVAGPVAGQGVLHPCLRGGVVRLGRVVRDAERVGHRLVEVGEHVRVVEELLAEVVSELVGEDALGGAAAGHGEAGRLFIGAVLGPQRVVGERLVVEVDAGAAGLGGRVGEDVVVARPERLVEVLGADVGEPPHRARVVRRELLDGVVDLVRRGGVDRAGREVHGGRVVAELGEDVPRLLLRVRELLSLVRRPVPGGRAVVGSRAVVGCAAVGRLLLVRRVPVRLRRVGGRRLLVADDSVAVHVLDRGRLRLRAGVGGLVRLRLLLGARRLQLLAAVRRTFRTGRRRGTGRPLRASAGGAAGDTARGGGPRRPAEGAHGHRHGRDEARRLPAGAVLGPRHGVLSLVGPVGAARLRVGGGARAPRAGSRRLAYTGRGPARRGPVRRGPAVRRGPTGRGAVAGRASTGRCGGAVAGRGSAGTRGPVAGRRAVG